MYESWEPAESRIDASNRQRSFSTDRLSFSPPPPTSSCPAFTVGWREFAWFPSNYIKWLKLERKCLDWCCGDAVKNPLGSFQQLDSSKWAGFERLWCRDIQILICDWINSRESMRSHGAGITGSCQCSSVHFHSNSTPMWISEPVILQLDRQQSRDFDETCKDFQRCRHDNNARDAKRSNVILGLMMGLVTSLRGGGTGVVWAAQTWWRRCDVVICCCFGNAFV